MKIIALLTISTLAFTSCATDTGDAAKDRRGRVTNAVLKEVFTAALSFGAAEGRAYLSGQNGQDAAAGAFEAAGQSFLSSSTFDHIVAAYAGPQVAKVAAQQFAKANPQTPGDRAMVANTIGAAFQQVANLTNPPLSGPPSTIILDNNP